MKVPQPVVCFVDSEEPHRELLKATLSEKGFKVCSFNDGAKLFRFLDGDGAKIRPSFIILDVSSNGLAGFEAARRLVERPGSEDVPIIMMAKHCDPEDRLEAQNAGAITCLPKPINMEQIEAELAKTKTRKARNKSIIRQRM